MMRFPDGLIPAGIASTSLCQEPQLRRANPDRDAVLEDNLGHANTVDEGPVCRTKIVEPAVAEVIHGDLRVVTRREAVLDQEVTAGLLADGKPVAEQQPLAGPRPVHDEEAWDRPAVRKHA